MKKFDKGYIYANLLSDLLASLVLLFAVFDDMLLQGEETVTVNVTVIPWMVAAWVVIYALFLTYRILYYRTSGYELTEREIKCKRGVLFKKNSMLDYQKIHAINKKQTLIHKLFGVAVLTVDSGSANTAHQAEITIFEKNKIVDALLAELHTLRENGVRVTDGEQVLLTEQDSLYRFTSKTKWLYTAISMAATALGTAITGILLGTIIGICYWLLKLDFFGTFGTYLITAVGIVAGAMLLLGVIAFFGAVLQSFVGYYNFRITKRDNDLEIAYGLLERHTNSFSYDRVKGVKISQGLMQRLFGFATVKLEVIGYANEAGNNSHVELGVLVPFCKYREVGEILSRILPAYIPLQKQTASPSFFPFVSWFFLILWSIVGTVSLLSAAVLAVCGVTAFVTAIVVSSLLFVGLLISALKWLHAYLNYKTSGIAVENDKITTYSGGFTKTVTVFYKNNLVAVESVTTPLRRKAGITSPVFHLRTNAFTNEVKVPIQDAAQLSAWESLLKL